MNIFLISFFIVKLFGWKIFLVRKIQNKVEANFVFNLDESEGDDQFINDDEIEDDTYIDYCDSEEDLHIEKDMNIDEYIYILHSIFSCNNGMRYNYTH